MMAFGQQQEGEAMVIAKRLLLLINDKFGTMLQAILTLYVPSLRQQQPQQEQQKQQRGAAAPVRDPD